MNYHLKNDLISEFKSGKEIKGINQLREDNDTYMYIVNYEPEGWILVPGYDEIIIRGRKKMLCELGVKM